ncbi:MAG: FAD-dependent oxidoreductase [Rhizobacter sp.]
MKHLVLLGGGPAHLRVLHDLAASPLPGARVTLIAPHGRHVAPAMVAGWISGRHTTAECCVALAPLAARAGVTLVENDALAVDAGNRQIALANGHTVSYDALSVDVPAAPDRDRIAGARENALFHRPFDHFLRLWGALVALAAEQALSVVVVGAEIPAIELALAVHLRLGKRARVALVTGHGAPVPHAPVVFQHRVRQLLKRGGVTLFEDRCDALFGNQMLLGQGLRLACDAPLVALEAGPPRWAPDSGLLLGHKGFIVVGDTLQSLSHPEVFASGEIAVRADGWRPSGGLQLRGRPEPLSLNLRRFLAGGQLVTSRRRSGHLHLIDLGQGRAVASVAGLSVSGRWVGWLKERADRERLAALRAPGAPLDAAEPEEPFLPTGHPADEPDPSV